MSDNDYDKINEEISKLYNEGKEVQVIANTLSVPRYLVESILIAKYNVIFRWIKFATCKYDEPIIYRGDRGEIKNEQIY